MTSDRYDFLIAYVLDKPEFKELFQYFLDQESRSKAFNEFEATQRIAVINFIRDKLDMANEISKQKSQMEGINEFQ